MCEIYFNILHDDQTLGGGQLSLPTPTIPTTVQDLNEALHCQAPSAAQILDIKHNERLIPGSSAFEVLQKVANHFVASFHTEKLRVVFFDVNDRDILGLTLTPYPTEHQEKQTHPSPRSLN